MNHHRVRLLRSEVSLDVAESETILDAALAAGVELPFSCTVGGCMACRKKLVAGVVEMEAPHGLSATAQGRGWILLCRARPRCGVEIDA